MAVSAGSPCWHRLDRLDVRWRPPPKYLLVEKQPTSSPPAAFQSRRGAKSKLEYCQRDAKTQILCCVETNGGTNVSVNASVCSASCNHVDTLQLMWTDNWVGHKKTSSGQSAEIITWFQPVSRFTNSESLIIVLKSVCGRPLAHERFLTFHKPKQWTNTLITSEDKYYFLHLLIS